MKFPFFCVVLIIAAVLHGLPYVTHGQEAQLQELFQQFSADYMLGKEVVRNNRKGLVDLAKQRGTIGELASEHRKLQAQSTLLKAANLPTEGRESLFNLAGLRYLLVHLPENPREEDVAAARDYLRQRGRDYIEALSNEADILKASQNIQTEQLALMKKLGSSASQQAAAASQPSRKTLSTIIYPNPQGNLGYTQVINRSGKDLHQCLLLITLVPGEETARMPLAPLLARGALKEDAEGTPKALEYTSKTSKAWYDLHSLPQKFPIYLPIWKKDESLIFTLGDAHAVKFAQSAALSLWSKELSFENHDLRVHQYLLTTEVKTVAMSRLPLPKELPGRGNSILNYKKNLDAAQSSRNNVQLKPNTRWSGIQTMIYRPNISRMFTLENRKKIPTSLDKYDIDLKIAGRDGKRFHGTVTMAGQTHDYEGVIEGTLVVIVTEKKGLFQHIYHGGIDSQGHLTVKGHGTHEDGYHMSGSAVLMQSGQSSR